MTNLSKSNLPGLSKSRYVAGLQCHRLLYTRAHNPDAIPEPDAFTQYLFDQGTAAGKLATNFFPGGTEIPAFPIDDSITKTKEALDKGALAGYPLVDLKATLYDGSYHDVDSSEIAFKIAGSIALQEAVKRADLILLEPIMKLEVITPEQFMGEVIGDLSAKRGKIGQMEDRGVGIGRVKVIDARVPLASMFGYATQLRSMTQGRATFTMEFEHYAEVPKNVVEGIIGEEKK